MVGSIKTLDNLLRFHKNGEDFNQGREPDTATGVHDVFLFYKAFFWSNLVFKTLSTTLLYITKQCLTMF